MLQMHRPIGKISREMVGDLRRSAYDQDIGVGIVE